MSITARSFNVAHRQPDMRRLYSIAGALGLSSAIGRRSGRGIGPIAAVGGGKVRPENCCRPNGSDAKLRGQGPRAEASAARHLPRLTTSRQERDAGGVTRSGF
jgi:hypothetical protein